MNTQVAHQVRLVVYSRVDDKVIQCVAHKFHSMSRPVRDAIFNRIRMRVFGAGVR